MTQLLQCFVVRLEIRGIIVALVLRHGRCAKLRRHTITRSLEFGISNGRRLYRCHWRGACRFASCIVADHGLELVQLA